MADSFDALVKQLNHVGQEATRLDPVELLELGHAAQTLILLRTKAGLDSERKPFAPYKPDYAQTRAARGLQTTPDLAVTGHMLGAVTVQAVDASTVDLAFVSAKEAEIASYHQDGTHKMPERNFFDIQNEQDIDALESMIGEAVLGRVSKSVK